MKGIKIPKDRQQIIIVEVCLVPSEPLQVCRGGCPWPEFKLTHSLPDFVTSYTVAQW